MPIELPSSGNGRLAVIGPSGAKIARLRGALIADCVARGIPVLALAPDMTATDSSSLIALGAEARAFVLRAPGFPLFRSTRAAGALAKTLKDWGATAVLAYGDVGPLAIRAARKARTGRKVLLVNELRERKLTKSLVASVRRADAVVAHNSDDARILARGVAKKATAIIRVAGAGAAVAAGEASPLPPLDGPVVFLAASRLDKVKGVLDYLEAARIARDTGLDARFVLAGPEGSEQGAIGADAISRYAAAVQYIGDQSDLGAALRTAHVFVCPSSCEGMPHAVLQAMAAGRAIVATDVAGARDTVDENVNGTLVPAGDAAALAEAFQRLVKNKALLTAMGRASYAKAARGFSVHDVNRALLEALRLL